MRCDIIAIALNIDKNMPDNEPAKYYRRQNSMNRVQFKCFMLHLKQYILEMLILFIEILLRNFVFETISLLKHSETSLASFQVRAHLTATSRRAKHC